MKAKQQSYPVDMVSKLSPADHLLFDIGYSAGLLMNTKIILQTVTEPGGYPSMWMGLIEAIEDFERGRLQLRGEIYANAEEAARRGTSP